jgi:dTDP-4-dehydrorhamnose reductase
MDKKVLIFGGEGWLAQKFYKIFPKAELSRVDITNLKKVKRELNKKKPDIVINAAGKTGRPNIDWCEKHREETYLSNVIGPQIILKACERKGIYLIHLSSGCIFQGKGPLGKGFKEGDKADPPSYYSWTKWLADTILSQELQKQYELLKKRERLKNLPTRLLIVRLRLPIDTKPHPRNLIDKLARYNQIIDTQNSVSVVPDFLQATKRLIEKKQIGIFHIVNPGTISPAEIMEAYQEKINPNYNFTAISNEDLYKGRLAQAERSNCILSTAGLRRAGIRLKPTKKRIVEIIEEYKKNLENIKS